MPRHHLPLLTLSLLQAAKPLDFANTLETFAQTLAAIPLLYHPGERWLYAPSPPEAYDYHHQPWPLQRGGSGLVSNLDGYMRFARMLLNEGQLDGARILQPETIRLMATDSIPSTAVLFTQWRPCGGVPPQQSLPRRHLPPLARPTTFLSFPPACHCQPLPHNGPRCEGNPSRLNG